MRVRVRNPEVKAKSYQGFGMTVFPKFPLSSPIEKLVVSGNPLPSFAGLLAYPHLVDLKCDNTKLSSFVGGVYLPNLKSISLANTPVSKYQHYRIMAGIVFGQQLERVDFGPIKKSEKRLIEILSPVVRDLIINGWIITLCEPIKLFHPQTKERKVIFLKPAQKEPRVKEPEQCVGEFRTFEVTGDSALAFRRNLQTILYTDHSTWKGDCDKVAILLTEKNPDLCLAFVREMLQAFNLRPMMFNGLCDFLIDCYQDHFGEILKSELLDCGFWSHGVMARVLNRLVRAGILSQEDLKPFFYSVYDEFESFDGKFRLNKHMTPEPFYRFFGYFAPLISKADPELYRCLVSELKSENKELLDELTNPEWQRLPGRVISVLTGDKSDVFRQMSSDEVDACLVDFFNIQTNYPKLVGAALAGARECFESVYDPDAIDDPILEKCAIIGGDPIILRNLPSIDPEIVVQYHQYLTQDGLTSVFHNASLLPVAIAGQNYREIMTLVDNNVRLDSSLLTEAIRSHQTELVHLLTLCGCHCERALELAIESRDPVMVMNVLASKFTNVNAVFGRHQWTGLHLAASLGNPVIVNVLLNAKGIDTEIKDIYGRTAEQVAMARKQKAVLQVLSQYSTHVRRRTQ